MKEKPSKPYPGFPLTAHPNGQWSKKIGGKVYYFGPWADWQAALERYEQMAPPEVVMPDDRLSTLCSAFMTHKQQSVDSGDIKPETWKEYDRVCKRFMGILGKTFDIHTFEPHHFQFVREKLSAQIPNPTTLKGELTKLRVLLNWAYESGAVASPLRYRTFLKKPPERLIRKARNEAKSRHYTREQVLRLMKESSGFIRVCIYMGINCGFGNTDCCDLQWGHVTGGWVTMPRTKTYTLRKVKLWEDTQKALDEWKLVAPDSEYVAGRRYGTSSNPVSHLFTDLPRDGLGFYSLRRTYRHVADSCMDQVAINYTMGHSDPSMASIYRGSVWDKRLVAVAQSVWDWLQGLNNTE